MEGPKLQDAESSAIIHWTCSEFCSREAKFQLEKCGVAQDYKITVSVFSIMFGCTVFFKTTCLLYASSNKVFATPGHACMHT